MQTYASRPKPRRKPHKRSACSSVSPARVQSVEWTVRQTSATAAPASCSRVCAKSETKCAAWAGDSMYRPARIGETKAVTGRCVPSSDSAKSLTGRVLWLGLRLTYCCHQVRAYAKNLRSASTCISRSFLRPMTTSASVIRPSDGGEGSNSIWSSKLPTGSVACAPTPGSSIARLVLP